MGISFFNTFIIHTILITTKKTNPLEIDLQQIRLFGKVRIDSLMVPKDRIELSADPYQGSVLPLNYIGMYYILSYLFFLFNINGVRDGSRTHIISVGGRDSIHWTTRTTIFIIYCFSVFRNIIKDKFFLPLFFK